MDFITKDSGKRQEYTTGMVRDLQDGKPDFYLCLPLDVPYNEQMLTRWAALMERGKTKYGMRNWEKSQTKEEVERFKSSAMRHFMQWIAGETDEDHAAAIFFNVTVAERLRNKV